MHRLTIRRNGRLLGHFDSDTPWAQEAVSEVAQQLSPALGFELTHQVAQTERRIVESSPQGMRVLSIEHHFVSTDIPL